MISIGPLVDTLKAAVKHYSDRPSAVLFLTYNPASGKWGFYDGSIVNDVWLAHNDPQSVTVLFLEPAAALSAIAADPWDSFEAALTRYATFTASRPNYTGLHHFIDVAPPEGLRQPATDGNGQALN